MTDELGGEVRRILDRHGERTVPQLWNRADMDTLREETGQPKPDSTSTYPACTEPDRPAMTTHVPWNAVAAPAH